MLIQNATIADILAYNCTAALLFNDEEDARETLAFLKTKPSILAAWIFTADGVPWPIMFEKGLAKKNAAPGSKERLLFKKRMLYLYKDVRMDGKPIGTVYIQSDMRQMSQIAKDHFLIAVLGLLFSLIRFLSTLHQVSKNHCGPHCGPGRLSRTVSKKKTTP
jgi:hypothetical protein